MHVHFRICVMLINLCCACSAWFAVVPVTFVNICLDFGNVECEKPMNPTQQSVQARLAQLVSGRTSALTWPMRGHLGVAEAIRAFLRATHRQIEGSGSSGGCRYNHAKTFKTC